MKCLPALFLLLSALVISSCKTLPASEPSQFTQFARITDFSNFKQSRNEGGSTVLLSPEINSPIPWNQLVVSWNVDAPPATFVTIEVAAVSVAKRTKFYSLGQWSPDGITCPRTSIRCQRDADGTVNTDTLVVNVPATATQVRLTLGGSNDAMPKLKLLGLSFCNTGVLPLGLPPNRAAWGQVIATPERSQHGYAGERGWCSPAALSMVLARWAKVLERPELDVSVPQVAAAVYDQNYAGTGNWPFNTAFAGGCRGLRSFVTRFDDLAEVEAWIFAGIPVILSAHWDLLQPGRPADTEGHLIVCVGFTKTGDVVVNDPAARLDRGESVLRVYRRQNVIRAWAKSHNTVYLIYPEIARVPPDRLGHWAPIIQP